MMIPQDLTKFTIVIVLLGAILTLAVFRPQILPPDLIQPVPVQTATPPPGLGETGIPLPETRLLSEEELNQRRRELDQRQSKLNERETELNRRQTKLDALHDELDRREVGLDEREAELNQRQIELDEQEADLEGKRVGLREWEKRLLDQSNLLDEREASLWNKQANLVEREQKLEGRTRFSLVALVVSAPLTVLSVLVLIALMRKNREAPTGGLQPIWVSQPDRRERETQQDKPAVVTPTPIYGGNGRNEESVSSALKGRIQSPH